MNRNTVETIKQKLSIESIVGSYVKLEKSGKNFRACCPFHHEKSPSFYVTPDRGIYYCYGCHKGGDIFSFVQEIEGVVFIDALKTLAEKAGVSLHDMNHEQPSRTGILREIMDTATKYYEVGLRTHKPVVDYLLGRGMTKETMIAFRVGYAPKGWSGLYETLKKKYTNADILATGLCLEGKQGLYDRFRERIMFPITDAQGRVIAFTGRVMPGTEEADKPVGKYINSPETDLYHKSAVLFGFDKAKEFILKEGFVILVEGQMDCIMSHQAGINHVVALSGTASTDLHMKQIARFTQNIAICLDADNAGLAAAQKTAMVAYAHDMKVLVIDITQGKDPADMIAENPDLWIQTVHRKKDFITFRLEKMKQSGTLDHKVAIAQKELFPVLAHITSQITLDDRLREIAHAFAMTRVDPVREEFFTYLKTRAPDQNVFEKKSPPKPEARSLEKQLQIMEHIFSDTVDPSDADALALVSQWDNQFGSFSENKPSYELLHKDLITLREMQSIDEELATLNRQLAEHSDDIELLKRIHEISRRKDTLVHHLTSR